MCHRRPRSRISGQHLTPATTAWFVRNAITFAIVTMRSRATGIGPGTIMR
jgi:hypothetical protein